MGDFIHKNPFEQLKSQEDLEVDSLEHVKKVSGDIAMVPSGQTSKHVITKSHHHTKTLAKDETFLHDQ